VAFPAAVPVGDRQAAACFLHSPKVAEIAPELVL
jgi:hypothetical protein